MVPSTTAAATGLSTTASPSVVSAGPATRTRQSSRILFQRARTISSTAPIEIEEELGESDADQQSQSVLPEYNEPALTEVVQGVVDSILSPPPSAQMQVSAAPITPAAPPSFLVNFCFFEFHPLCVFRSHLNLFLFFQSPRSAERSARYSRLESTLFDALNMTRPSNVQSMPSSSGTPAAMSFSEAKEILENFLNQDLDLAAESQDFSKAVQAAHVLMTNDKLPAGTATFLADFSTHADSILFQYRSQEQGRAGPEDHGP